MKLAFFIGTLLLLFTACMTISGSGTNPAAASSVNAPSASPLSFVVVGDWGRRGSYNQREVGQQMGVFAERIKSSFTVSVGDNFYDDGVTSTTDSHWQESFESIYTAPSLQSRWYVCLGNHDYRGSIAAQIQYTKLSPRWFMPATYFCDTKKVDDSTTALFVYLDTDPLILNYHKGNPGKPMHDQIVMQDTAAQLRWCDSVLANSTAQWKFVFGHHPVFSAGNHGNMPEMISRVLPMLRRYGVQAYFCGHDHDLQFLKSDSIDVNFIISGGGSEVRSVGTNPYSRFGKGISGFVTATLTGRDLTINYIDYQGNTLYNTIIPRNPIKSKSPKK